VRFIALLILPLLIGTLLLWRGLRGVRVDDHPICRKCGFDLTGRPEGSDKCAECGADLTARRAVRHGHRRRRPVMLGIGLLALLPVMGLVALVTWVHVRDLDEYRLLPTWYILREARQGSPGVPVAAWQELVRRLGAGQLSKENIERASELALAIQGDQSKTWNAVIGDFVESARVRGSLTDAQWARYARQAPMLTLTLRPQVRRGDGDLPARIAAGNARVGSNSRLNLRIHDIDGEGDLIKPPDPRGRSGSGYTGFGLSAGGGASTIRNLELDPRAVADAKLGTRDARVRLKMSVREGWDDDNKKPVLAEWEEVMKGNWDLVAADAQTVKLIDDESYRAAVEAGTTIKFLGERSPGIRGHLNLDIEFKRIPVPLAHEVFLREPGGREHKFTSINLARGDVSYGTGAQIKALGADSVDVIFRPAPAVARQTVEMTEMWNHEFIIRNVRVQRATSATSATTRPSAAATTTGP
jgi:hypothetical protein